MCCSHSRVYEETQGENVCVGRMNTIVHYPHISLTSDGLCPDTLQKVNTALAASDLPRLLAEQYSALQWGCFLAGEKMQIKSPSAVSTKIASF